jgi:predicted LPLAT superfamily acyltransferase
MLLLARVMESVASLYPDQWFSFYDVWPEPGSPASRATANGRA